MGGTCFGNKGRDDWAQRRWHQSSSRIIGLFSSSLPSSVSAFCEAANPTCERSPRHSRTSMYKWREINGAKKSRKNCLKSRLFFIRNNCNWMKSSPSLPLPLLTIPGRTSISSPNLNWKDKNIIRNQTIKVANWIHSWTPTFMSPCFLFPLSDHMAPTHWTHRSSIACTTLDVDLSLSWTPKHQNTYHQIPNTK